MSTIEAIRADIDDARQSLQAQIDDLARQIEALTEASNWLGIATGDPEVDAPSPEMVCVNCDHDDHYGERCGGACDDGDACACSWPDAGNFTATPEPATATTKTERKPRSDRKYDWPAIFEWVKAAKADGTFSAERLRETFGSQAKNWKAECAKLGLTLDAPKLPKRDFDEQAARDAVAGPPTGPVKPVSIMPLAATPEPKPRDAGYVSVGQVVAAAGDL